MRTDIFNRKKQKPLRQKLRNNATESERILWAKLKNSQTGFKFRRQHGIGKYIVDFCCPKLRLVIEIDGDSHFLDNTAKQKDEQRETYIKAQGFTIKRYTNIEIKTNLIGVLDDLYMFFEKVNHPLTPSFPRKGNLYLK